MTNRFLLTIAFGMLSACVLLGDDQGKKADPEATKVLAEARRARANWTKFPGLTADMTVTINGKTEKGILQVSEKGKVTKANYLKTWLIGPSPYCPLQSAIDLALKRSQ